MAHDARVGLTRDATRALFIGIAALLVRIALSAPRLTHDPADVIITWIALCSFVGVGVSLFVVGNSPVNGWGCIVVAWSLVPGDLNSPHWQHTGWPVPGYVLEAIYLPAAVALALRYPNERLRPSYRRLVAALAVACVLFRLVVVATPPGLEDNFYNPPWWPRIAGAQWWHDVVGVRIGRGTTAALLVVAACMLLLRAARAAGLARQSILPLAIIGSVTSLAAALDQAAWLGLGLEWAKTVAAAMRNVAAAFIPVALLADLLRRHSAISAVSDTVLEAARSGNLASIQDALSSVLVDPTLRVAARPSSGRWVGADGRDWAATGTSSVREVRSDEGIPLLRFAYDRRAVQDERVLDVCTKALRVGLENTRLQTDLLAHVAKLQTSRARIVQAAMEERRRVERDLHDGVQQSLLAAMTTLARAELVRGDEAASITRAARAQVNQALVELRDLARGIYPAVLVKGGLPGALAELCAKSGTDAQLRVDPVVLGRRFDPAIESAMYFFVAEALVNVTKHAPAAHVEVTLNLDGARVIVRVSDNGPGGGTVTSGRGLTGLHDRISALGGDMTVHSDPCCIHRDAHGTTLYAAVPVQEGASNEASQPRSDEPSPGSAGRRLHPLS